MRASSVSLILLGFALAAANHADAGSLPGQEHESRILSDRWNVTLGGAAVDFSTTAAIGSGTILGSILRLEDTLGLQEDLQRARLGGFYRFNRKQSILFSYTVLNREAVRAIGESFTILDPPLTFSVGALVRSRLDNTIFSVSYKHSFVNNGKTEAGFGAGFSTFAFDVSLQGIATFQGNDGMMVTREVSGSESIVIPVPNLGMFINHAITPKLILRMSAGFLDLSVGDFEGSYLATNVTFDWIFTRHFGLGAGFMRADLSFLKTGNDGYKIEYRLGGPTAYVSLVF